MLYIATGLAVAGVIVIALLVVISIRQEVKQVEAIDAQETKPSDEWLRMAYQAANSLYIEVDREIWQISTIFIAASLLLMGWVVTSFDNIDFYLSVVLGCASIILVGLATLFKHRLRAFNLFHISYMRRLEQAGAGTEEGAQIWGLHYLRKRMKTKGDILKTATSIHGVMDIYFFLFIILWVAIWLILLV